VPLRMGRICGAARGEGNCFHTGRRSTVVVLDRRICAALNLGHRGFAVIGPHAPPDDASQPFPVHRPAVYAPGFLPTPGRALAQLPFPSLSMA